jgi:hypothetical protein
MPAERRGQVTHVEMESTGDRRNSCLGGGPAGLPWGGTSRMRREFHVRICEGLGVKYPGPTRRIGQPMSLPRHAPLGADRGRRFFHGGGVNAAGTPAVRSAIRNGAIHTEGGGGRNRSGAERVVDEANCPESHGTAA